MSGYGQYGFGSGSLWAVPTYGLDGAAITPAVPVPVAGLQEGSVEISGNLKDLFGGNTYALITLPGQKKITGKSKFGVISARSLNLFFGETPGVGEVRIARNEVSLNGVAGEVTWGEDDETFTIVNFSQPTGYFDGGILTFTSGPNAGISRPVVSFVDYNPPEAPTGGRYVTVSPAFPQNSYPPHELIISPPPGIPVADPYAITVDHADAFGVDLGVFWAASDLTSPGLPLTRVADSPVTGQYAVDANGVYTFAAADTGRPVLISYSYLTVAEPGRVLPINNQLLGVSLIFKAVLNLAVAGKSLTLLLNKCTSNKLTLGTKLEDYLIPELDFAAQDDGAGAVGSISLNN